MRSIGPGAARRVTTRREHHGACPEFHFLFGARQVLALRFISVRYCNTMASLPELAETHGDLISSLEAFYRIPVDLDYLREEEVQFPPHTEEGKIPIATAAIQSVGLTQKAEQLLHLLPYVTPASLSLFDGESRITLSSKPVSYLDKGEEDLLHDERSFGFGDDGEILLPPWALKIFTSTNSGGKIAIYDTRNSISTAFLDLRDSC
jgi:hypothetical protein